MENFTSLNINSSLIEIIKGDITKIVVDAIVNAANYGLLGGGGVDGAIHKSGGSIILEECKKIVVKQGGCKVGEAVITSAGNLPAKFVIHTVGPVWNGGMLNETVKLAKCYKNSLKLAADNKCKTIAFPNISTGIFKFPKQKAGTIAVNTTYNFLKGNNEIQKVIFVCYDDESFNIMINHLKTIKEKIETKMSE